MNFNSFKKHFNKLSICLDIADIELKTIWNDLPLTDDKKAKEVIKRGKSFNIALNSWINSMDNKNISEDAKLSLGKMYDDVNDIIDEYFDELYKERK